MSGIWGTSHWKELSVQQPHSCEEVENVYNIMGYAPDSIRVSFSADQAIIAKTFLSSTSTPIEAKTSSGELYIPDQEPRETNGQNPSSFIFLFDDSSWMIWLFVGIFILLLILTFSIGPRKNK